MDKETKEYIDRKFAEAAQRKQGDQEKAFTDFRERAARTKKFVYLCAGILTLLLLILVGLLAWAQFIPHSR